MFLTKKNILILFITIIVIYALDETFDRVNRMEPVNLSGDELGRRMTKKRTYEEFVKIANLDHNRPMSIKWIKLPDMTSFLPTYLKYKEKILLSVRDQGACASCWSFGVTQMLGDRISIFTGGKVMEHLSAQEMVSCWDNSIEDNIGCLSGGVPELAYRYIMKHGISLEKDYPYVQFDSTDIVKCDRSKMTGKRVYIEEGSARSLCRDPAQFDVGSKKYNDTVRENILNMKKEIFTNGEICGTIMAYQNLYSYDGLSVYKEKKGSLVGGHLVNIIGWSEKNINGVEPGFDEPYWICKNFWSTEWPSKSPSSQGYFYVKMGINLCGIESRASRAFPVLTEEIRRNMISNLRSTRYESLTEYVDDPERKLYIESVGRIRGWLK